MGPVGDQMRLTLLEVFGVADKWKGKYLKSFFTGIFLQANFLKQQKD